MKRRLVPSRFASELDWNLLGTFVVIAESRSITVASHRLRLKQPSVSAALKRLEDRVGCRLIERSPTQFELTEVGEMLLQEARHIEGAIEHLATLIAEKSDEVTGHVRVGMASHVEFPALNDILGDFLKTNTRATLSIEVSSSMDAVAAVSGRSVSFAICLADKFDPKLEYSVLYREIFGLYCGPSHPFFGRTDLTDDDLVGQTSVSFYTDRFQNSLKPISLTNPKRDYDERVVGSSNHLEEVRRLTIAGVGIGSFPTHIAARDVKDGLLWQVPPYEGAPEIDVFLISNPGASMNKAERKLLQMLKQVTCPPRAPRS